MAASCKLSTLCTDDAQVVRPTYASRYGPESDAEFVKLVAERRLGQGGDGGATPLRGLDGGAGVVDVHSCRQRYLRSYKFVRKETVQEKARRLVGAVREKAGELRRRRRSSACSPDGSVGSSRSGKHAKGGDGARSKKWCTKLMCLLLRRMLSCTGTAVDVADGN